MPSFNAICAIEQKLWPFKNETGVLKCPEMCRGGVPGFWRLLRKSPWRREKLTDRNETFRIVRKLNGLGVGQVW